MSVITAYNRTTSSNLDPDTKKDIVDLIADITHEAFTMLKVTHEPAFIECLATRIIRMGPKCAILSDDKIESAA